MLLNGRLLEVTNGCFVDAQREKPRLGVGQLQRNPTGGFGSGGATQHRHQDARQPTLNKAARQQSFVHLCRGSVDYFFAADSPKQVSLRPLEEGDRGFASQCLNAGVIVDRQIAGTRLANISKTYPAGKRGESGASESR